MHLTNNDFNANICVYISKETSITESLTTQVIQLKSYGYNILLVVDESVELPAIEDIPYHQISSTVEHIRRMQWLDILRDKPSRLILSYDLSINKALYDGLFLKSVLGIPLILVEGEQVIQQPYEKEYTLVDRIIVPSQIKQLCYQMMGINTTFVPIIQNTISNEEITVFESKYILWLGLDNALEEDGITALQTLQAIHTSCPHMISLVPSIHHLDKNLQRTTIGFLQSQQLQNHVKWLSPEEELRWKEIHIVVAMRNVWKYIKHLTIAKTYGIPTIGSKSTLADALIDTQGCTLVHQEDKAQLINTIYCLAFDELLWKEQSNAAQIFTQSISNQDIKTHWKQCLDSILTVATDREIEQSISKENKHWFWQNIDCSFKELTHYCDKQQLIGEFDVLEYLKYKILTKITWGKLRQKYQIKFHKQVRIYNTIRQIEEY